MSTEKLTGISTSVGLALTTIVLASLDMIGPSVVTMVGATVFYFLSLLSEVM